MILKHGDYLSYELPKNWTAEEDDDNLLIYNPDGNGSVTVSFFNILDSSVFLDEYVSIFAKKFIDKNNIKMHSPLILLTKEGKTVLSGTGTDSDGWFIKLWIVYVVIHVFLHIQFVVSIPVRTIGSPIGIRALPGNP